jgi:adenosine deaminase
LEKYGGDSQIKTPADIEKKFVFRDFEHFLELWFWKNQYYKEPADFEDCAYKTLEHLSHQNVIYCEMFYSPWDFISEKLSVEDITESVLCGINRAKNEFPIDCALIADIVRDYDSDSAIDRVKQVEPYNDQGVIGIGLGGSEQKYPARLFSDAFKRARDCGFHLTAHAGEASGPESVWEAINVLNAERIGHGVRAIEDPQLIEYLKNNNIPLEVCVNSNLKTKIFALPELHPIKKFIDMGLNITINSDDPSMFGASLTEEFFILLDQYQISLDNIRQLTLNALNSAFVSDEARFRLREKIDCFWNAK